LPNCRKTAPWGGPGPPFFPPRGVKIPLVFPRALFFSQNVKGHVSRLVLAHNIKQKSDFFSLAVNLGPANLQLANWKGLLTPESKKTPNWPAFAFHLGLFSTAGADAGITAECAFPRKAATQEANQEIQPAKARPNQRFAEAKPNNFSASRCPCKLPSAAPHQSVTLSHRPALQLQTPLTTQLP